MPISLENESGYFSPCPDSGHFDSFHSAEGSKALPRAPPEPQMTHAGRAPFKQIEGDKVFPKFFRVHFNAFCAIAAHTAEPDSVQTRQPDKAGRAAGPGCSQEMPQLPAPSWQTDSFLSCSNIIRRNQSILVTFLGHTGEREKQTLMGLSHNFLPITSTAQPEEQEPISEALFPTFHCFFLLYGLPYPFSPFCIPVQGYGGRDGVLQAPDAHSCQAKTDNLVP